MIKLSRLEKLCFVAAFMALLTGTLGVQPVVAQPEPASANLSSRVPTTVFPKGTVPINHIIYIWSEVSGATKYHLQVRRGSTIKVDNTYTSSACHSGTCSATPSGTLNDGSYQWRVKAYVSGAYRSYSSWRPFTVSAPSSSGFYSSFTSNASGWYELKGDWKLQDSNYYTTTGVAGKTSTIRHSGEYTTLTFQARMKRTGCPGCANALAIRGNPTLDSTGWWKTEYTFDYTNSGLFSVWRDYYGSYTALKDWTYVSGVIDDGGWNTLKVTADGSKLKFYINGHLVWSGSDSSYSSGQVGIGMYRSYTSYSQDKLWVDWAKLETAVADAANMDQLVVAGVDVPGGDRNTAPIFAER
jgi:hypothetical protein